MKEPVNLTFAKRLKEQGFNKPCEYYYQDKDLSFCKGGLKKTKDGQKMNHNEYDSFIYSAPTIKEAAKWLQDTRNIWINANEQLPEINDVVDLWFVPEDEEKSTRINGHVFKGSFYDFKDKGHVAAWIPHESPGVEFNNLREQIAYSLDRIIKTLNAGILEGVEYGDSLAGESVEGDLLVYKEDLDNDINELRTDVLFLISCFDKRNPNFQPVYEQVKKSGGIAKFNESEEE